MYIYCAKFHRAKCSGSWVVVLR